jgi:hypothetical protein
VGWIIAMNIQLYVMFLVLQISKPNIVLCLLVRLLQGSDFVNHILRK